MFPAIFLKNALRKRHDGDSMEIAWVDPEVIEIFPCIVVFAGVDTCHMVEGNKV